jgi:hypothetical protein
MHIRYQCSTTPQILAEINNMEDGIFKKWNTSNNAILSVWQSSGQEAQTGFQNKYLKRYNPGNLELFWHFINEWGEIGQ